MKVNKIHRSLLDKSISAMLSAIEIYNKPNFLYREEAFAILAVNAWELIIKAHYFQLNKFKINSLLEMQYKPKKDGSTSTRKTPVLNRSKQSKTLPIHRILIGIKQLINNYPKDIECNLESLIELRDNSIHFTNIKPISKHIQELGFACIQNYINYIKRFEIKINLEEYNFYLMPLAYLNSKTEAECIIIDENKKYIEFIQEQIKSKDPNENDFDIAVKIDFKFVKGNSFDCIPVTQNNENAPSLKIEMTEEDITKKYPLAYTDVVQQAKKRYDNFSQNIEFQNKMKAIKKNTKLSHERKLDPSNAKTQKKFFYDINIWQELDKIYTKKVKS